MLALCDKARLDECVDVYRRNSYPRIAEVRLALLFIGLASPLTLSPGLQLTMLINTSSDFELTIRQQPDRARVAGGKEKGWFVACRIALDWMTDCRRTQASRPATDCAAPGERAEQLSRAVGGIRHPGELR